MFHVLIALLLGLVQPAAPYISQTVSIGGVLASASLTDPTTGLTVSVPLVGLMLEPGTFAPEPAEKSQQLSTTIADPANPDEPTTVTTTRGPNETLLTFWERHEETVRLVRRKLRTPQ